MSEYNKTILTNEGIDLARRANKGTATFSLTRGVSSTDNLSGKTVEELQNLTTLPSIQQSVTLSDVVNTTDNSDTVLGIRMTFDNQNLKIGYNVHTVGIYAKEPDKNEILYGIATAKTPEYIPDFSEQTLFKFDFLMYLVIGRTDKVTVEVNPDDVYRKKDTYNKTEIDAKVSDAVSKLNDKDAEILKNLNDYKQENKTYHQNLEQQLDTKADKSAVNQQLETKADKSTTYTKDEVNNIISPKADKSYVDGELSKKADKATTYTKDEVNNKIAGQVKSVNGHRADSNGEVTLPKLKATTLISYDVANKSGTLDENAGFDSNGNFSRRPVDQLVIGQLADAINAKLPIEAGAADDDLCHLTSSKISFWNGNGENVKNLPPMNNKECYFAIRLVGPGGWGSVTVIDQDGTYWLNNKNGDIWTGWKRIANIDEVNSRLPLGGGEMAKGSTILWQGTNAGPNIQEGNIGGLQWNGATDYVKIFGDNNSSDNLDLAIQLGDDNSNRISIRNALGTETAAILADGHYTGTVNWDCVNGRPDINNANPVVTVINSFDVANVKEGPHQTCPVKQPWLVDQMALHPFAEAINALNTNLSTLRTELMNLKRRVDYNSPQGSFSNTTVNINDLRSTGIYRLANCYIQNGPYPTNNVHWIYVKVTVFDENTVYQTLYEGDNMYGRKSSSPTNWDKWYKYLNQAV
ncbi:DUF4795 domain-containing protein [Lactobacillus gasseri]|uniref:DUF4795 domain-containing protein n=1 Tax=Lactobacillus gasseri TaxID=1596 RepID=UPI00118318CA|nr:DUF4795 domain-containing protein [Lactobacillus gasseri]